MMPAARSFVRSDRNASTNTIAADDSINEADANDVNESATHTVTKRHAYKRIYK